MGSFSLLVAGDWRREIEPELEIRYIENPLSPNIRCVNVIDRLNTEYQRALKTELKQKQTSFAHWLREARGLQALAANEAPALSGAHQHGWVRLDGRGGVGEVIYRNPDPSFLCVLGDPKIFLLKPNAKGWEVNPGAADDIEIDHGYVSSARLYDIDFATMREPHAAQAPENWDRARGLAAGRSWTPFKVFAAQHGVSSVDDSSAQDAAFREWRKQGVIQELREEKTLSRASPTAIDAFLLSRDDYVKHCIHRAEVLGCSELHIHGKLINFVDEGEMLSRLSDDCLLTYLVVKH